MKTRFLISFLAAAVALASCQDSSYRGSADEFFIEDQPVPVSIMIGDINDKIVDLWGVGTETKASEEVRTKGTGPKDVEEEGLWAGEDMYIYSFKKDMLTSYKAMSVDQPLECLIDGSIDTPGSVQGKRARLNDLDAYISWQGLQKVIYYHEGTQPYEFFAYYIDDLELKEEDFVRENDAVKINVKIDGAHDLMSSHGKLTEAQLYGGSLSDKDRLNCKNYSFSAYTALRNIQPVLIFKHHLTRFTFSVAAGRDRADAVIIDSIRIHTKTKGVFTVAAKNPNHMGVDFSGTTEYEWLHLRNDDGTMIPPGSMHTHPYDPEAPSQEQKHLGTLMVAPDMGYKLEVYAHETTVNGNLEEYKNADLVLTPPDGEYFQAGHEYKVKLTIYGLMEMGLDIQLVEWEDGGDINIDNDWKQE